MLPCFTYFLPHLHRSRTRPNLAVHSSGELTPTTSRPILPTPNMSSTFTANRRANLNIPKRINTKQTWRNEPLQFAKIEIESKETEKAAQAAFSHARRNAAKENQAPLTGCQLTGFLADPQHQKVPLEQKRSRCNVKPQLAAGFFPQEKAYITNFGYPTAIPILL